MLQVLTIRLCRCLNLPLLLSGYHLDHIVKIGRSHPVHLVQNHPQVLPPPVAQPRKGIGAADSRTGYDGCEERRFNRRQSCGAFAEIISRCGSYAVNPVPPFYNVQVDLHYPLLVEALFEGDSDQSFLQLPA